MAVTGLINPTVVKATQKVISAIRGDTAGGTDTTVEFIHALEKHMSRSEAVGYAANLMASEYSDSESYLSMMVYFANGEYKTEFLAAVEKQPELALKAPFDTPTHTIYHNERHKLAALRVAGISPYTGFIHTCRHILVPKDATKDKLLGIGYPRKPNAVFDFNTEEEDTDITLSHILHTSPSFAKVILLSAADDKWAFQSDLNGWGSFGAETVQEVFAEFAQNSHPDWSIIVYQNAATTLLTHGDWLDDDTFNLAVDKCGGLVIKRAINNLIQRGASNDVISLFINQSEADVLATVKPLTSRMVDAIIRLFGNEPVPSIMIANVEDYVKLVKAGIGIERRVGGLRFKLPLGVMIDYIGTGYVPSAQEFAEAGGTYEDAVKIVKEYGVSYGRYRLLGEELEGGSPEERLLICCKSMLSERGLRIYEEADAVDWETEINADPRMLVIYGSLFNEERMVPANLVDAATRSLGKLMDAKDNRLNKNVFGMFPSLSGRIPPDKVALTAEMLTKTDWDVPLSSLAEFFKASIEDKFQKYHDAIIAVGLDKESGGSKFLNYVLNTTHHPFMHKKF